MVTKPGVPFLTWVALSGYSQSEIACSCGSSMHLMPLTGDALHHQCKKCNYKLMLEDIPCAFQVAQEHLESEIPVALLFTDGRIEVERTEIVGATRATAHRKILSLEFQKNIIDLLSRQIEKLFQIHLMNIRDLFLI